MSYLCEITDNNMTYSIDKIRLKSYINYSQFEEITFRFKTYYNEFIKLEWIGKGISEFHYNYKIEIDEGKSFYFGFQHNNEKHDLETSPLYNFTIEFNPNKLQDNIQLLYILHSFNQWYIKSVDFACDIPINILDIIYDMSGKRISNVRSYGYDNKTIYLGSGNNKIKIYNKKIESNLNIIGELTRVEVTTEYPSFPVSDIKFFYIDNIFPTLYTQQYMYTFKDYEDKTLLAILYAVQNGFPLRNLSRAYKQKIKNLYEGGNKIQFNLKIFITCMVKLMLHYFLTKDSKVVFK